MITIIVIIVIMTTLLLNNVVLISFILENLYTRDDGLIEGDIKLLPGQTRASVPNKLWTNGVFIYDIESSLSE